MTGSKLEMPYNINCGYFDCSEFAGLTLSPKRPVVQFEIEYYTCDAGKTMVNDKTYLIMSDHVLIGKAGQTRNSELPFKTMFLKFNVSGRLAEILNSMPEYFRVLHIPKARELLKNIILFSESGDGTELLMYSKILNLIQLLKEDSELSTKKPSLSMEENDIRYDIAKKSQHYMETHFAEKIALADVANAVGLSSNYFHTLFREATGVTPHDYLISCRVNAAKELLWDSTISMSEVAERCGFGCQQYLNNVFKNTTGLSPGRYRKESLKKYEL